MTKMDLCSISSMHSIPVQMLVKNKRLLKTLSDQSETKLLHFQKIWSESLVCNIKKGCKREKICPAHGSTIESAGNPSWNDFFFQYSNLNKKLVSPILLSPQEFFNILLLRANQQMPTPKCVCVCVCVCEEVVISHLGFMAYQPL